MGFATSGYRVGNEHAIKYIVRPSQMFTEDQRINSLLQLKKNKCVSLENIFGFDLWNGIIQERKTRYNSTTNMTEFEDEDEEDDFHVEVQENASKGQITKAFIAARRERLNLRSVLQGFIKKIAA